MRRVDIKPRSQSEMFPAHPMNDSSSDELPEPGPEVDDMGRFIFRLCVGYILVVGVVVYLGWRLFGAALAH